MQDIARMGNITKAYRILIRNSDRKRPFLTPRHTEEENIRIDLQETGWVGVDCTHLAQGRVERRNVVRTQTNLRVP